MNKRKYKKKLKKIENYVKENFDVLEEDGNYRTIPIRCHSCEYFEPGDFSVGMIDSCEAPVLYDEEDEIIDSVNDKIINYMSLLGYGCSYYKMSERFKRNNK